MAGGAGGVIVAGRAGGVIVAGGAEGAPDPIDSSLKAFCTLFNNTGRGVVI